MKLSNFIVHQYGSFESGFNPCRYAQDNLGVKKVSAPSKNPAKCPIICFAREKKIISRTFKISGALIVKLALGRVTVNTECEYMISGKRE
jgi:hypothetical protein